jgi:hypothetical protein
MGPPLKRGTVLCHRIYIVMAFSVAIVATVAGWSQSVIYKEPSPVALALWFPIVVLMKTRGETAIVLSLVQFPLFAIAFALGIHRWAVGRVLTGCVIAYLLLVGIAFATVRSR